jgi:hypothetical protein
VVKVQHLGTLFGLKMFSIRKMHSLIDQPVRNVFPLFRDHVASRGKVVSAPKDKLGELSGKQAARDGS